MGAIFFEVESEKPLEVEAKAIRARAEDARPPAGAPAPEGTPRPHGSARLDGRNGARVAAGTWQPAWILDLDPGFAPGFVLQARDRIVLQEPSSWLLLDRGGRVLRREPRGAGDLVLDAEQGLLYSTDPNAFVAAAKLASGEPSHLVAAMFGRGWQREVLAARGSRLWIRSAELSARAAVMRPPEYGVFEHFDLGDPIQTEDGQAISAQRLASVMSRTRPLLAALDGETIVVAVPDHILRLDAQLRLVSDQTSDFHPTAVSVDEEGRVHLVVRVDGETRLWVVTREGDRTLDVRLEIDAAAVIAPPVLGYDRTIHVVTQDRVVAVPSAGAPSRSYEAGRAIGGVVATPDPAILISAGRELVRIDAAGERRVLYQAPEELRTSPALAADGGILVASGTKLFALRPESP